MASACEILLGYSDQIHTSLFDQQPVPIPGFPFNNSTASGSYNTTDSEVGGREIAARFFLSLTSWWMGTEEGLPPAMRRSPFSRPSLDQRIISASLAISGVATRVGRRVGTTTGRPSNRFAFLSKVPGSTGGGLLSMTDFGVGKPLNRQTCPGQSVWHCCC